MTFIYITAAFILGVVAGVCIVISAINGIGPKF